MVEIEHSEKDEELRPLKETEDWAAEAAKNAVAEMGDEDGYLADDLGC